MLDAIIVGAGPAGLSAALILGRCRRRVLVCDAGKQRNRTSAAMHSFLSRDGLPPLEFLRICRMQLRRYPCVELRFGEVTRAERVDGVFHVVVDDNFSACSRKLLLATGIVDVLPSIEGFEQFYGKTIHHCPYCDGWEHKDKAVGILGGGQRERQLAVELLNWSDDLIIFSNGPAPAGLREELFSIGVELEEAPVSRLEGEGERLQGVRLSDDRLIAREGLFFFPVQRQRSPLAEQLGCRFDSSEAIECMQGTQTTIPGLYAAGNASVGLQLAIIAAAEGAQAAYSINEALSSEPGESLLL